MTRELAVFVTILLVLLALSMVAPQPLVQAQEPKAYGGCPSDADAICRAYHPNAPNVRATAFCLYEGCFEMSDGEQIRVVAADGMGAFPRQWFIWTNKDVEALFEPAGNFPCALSVSKQGKKTRVELPEGYPKCLARTRIGPYIYAEHYASNPITGCLAWLECRFDAPQ